MSPKQRRAPGERMAEVEAALLEATRRRGTTVTVAQICEVNREMGGRTPRRAFDKTLHALERAGRATCPGGRYSHTQWRHTSLPVPLAVDELTTSIIRAVGTLCRKHARPVSSGEVQRELAAEGYTLSVDQTRTRLATLAHMSTQKQERSHTEWASPRVTRIVEQALGGKPRVRWAPVDHDFSATSDSSHASLIDACRYAVQEAQREAGKPLSRRQLKIWLGHAMLSPFDRKHAAAQILLQPHRLRQALANAINKGIRLPNALLTVHAMRTALTCRGHYPLRYYTGSLPDVEALACLIEDVCMLLRPADELASIESLTQTADQFGSGILSEIAQRRFEALSASLHLYLGDVNATQLANAVEISVTSLEAVARWEREAEGRHARYHREAEVIICQVESISPLLATAARCKRELVLVGPSTGVPVISFMGMLREVMQLNDRRMKYPAVMLNGVRRVRGPIAGGVSSSDPDDERTFVDRADAIVRLTQRCYLPRMAAYVEAGAGVLGTVLRDEELLLECQRNTPEHDAYARMALASALSLLGDASPIELVWPDAADPDQARTYMASVALAVDDDERRLRLAEAADMRARGAACRVTGSALLHVEAGARLSVVEE